MDDKMRENRDGPETGAEAALAEMDSLILSVCRVLVGLIEENRDPALQVFVRGELAAFLKAREAIT